MKLQCIQNDLTWFKTEISRQHEHVLSCATYSQSYQLCVHS